MNREPYQYPPIAPILYIKPRNTWSTDGAAIPVPAGARQLKMGGTLGVVIGKPAFEVPAKAALGYIGGYTIVNDVSIPHESYYRPAIKQQCRDGFCPISSSLAELANPNRAEIRIRINGELRCTASTAELVRPVERLIADVTEFMTLQPGDVLLVGEPHDAPLAGAGDRVRVEIEGLGSLENQVVPEP
jgi:5-oxopent-3-ene-1,2,5-tricarboxylate decarboxylase/2-hydroxyhepta-2,4-diene-1,7-dioate isomerase